MILVLDVSGHAQSAAAVALGCARFDPRIDVAGVVLNKVASERHRRLVEDGLARVGLPVLGALMRDADLALPERHLGLVQAGETEELDARLERLADAVEGARRPRPARRARPPTQLDDAPDVARRPCRRRASASRSPPTQPSPSSIRMCSPAGARPGPRSCTFSPLADEASARGLRCLLAARGLPGAARGRASPTPGRFLDGLRSFAESRPVHGECGGYMVLGQSLKMANGHAHPMAGLLPVETSYAKRKLHLGYRVAHLLHDGVLGRAGSTPRRP